MASFYEYDPTKYGASVGEDYDDLYPSSGLDTDAAVAMLAELARRRADASLLELGIGTGRIALPLRRLGLRVAGIDSSERMLEQLRRKPDGDSVELVLGDYRDARVPGRFSVVALVFNNILDPRGLPAQLDIFRNAARHLDPGGCFVVESMVLSESQLSGDWAINPRYVGHQHVELQLTRFDLETHRIERTFVHLRPEGLRFVTVSDGYASPRELDIMAEVSGFRLRERYASWSCAPYVASSSNHVSVYELIRHV